MPRTVSALRRFIMIESLKGDDDDRSGVVGRRRHLAAIYHQPQIVEVKFFRARQRIVPQTGIAAGEHLDFEKAEPGPPGIARGGAQKAPDEFQSNLLSADIGR